MKGRLWILLVGWLLPATAIARTITVAKDGSGEFTVIQNALDVSQPGDTVEIGPGRYDDVRLVQFPLEAAYVAMVPPVGNVTIRGDDAGRTSIGFAEPTPTLDGHYTSALVIQAGVSSVRIEALQFEHMYQLVVLYEAASFVDCAFSAPVDFAVGLSAVDGARFIRCLFQNPSNAEPVGDFVVSFVGEANPNTVFEDCLMRGEAVGYGIRMSSAQNLRVERCSFSDMRIGVHINYAVGATIRNCRFENIQKTDLVLDDGCDVMLQDNILGRTPLITLAVYGAARVVGTRNRLTGSPRSTMYTLGGVEIQLTDGDIFNGGGLSVEALSPREYTPRFDLSSNYWGTTDLAQIATWIQDGTDPRPPGCWYCPAAVVEYLPILQGTVPDAATSFGGLKARYGEGW